MTKLKRTIALFLSMGLFMPAVLSQGQTRSIPDFYQKIGQDVVRHSGTLTVIEHNNQVYLGIPEKELGHDFLLTVRTTGVTNNFDVVAGQIANDPICFTIEKQNGTIFFKRNNNKTSLKKGAAFKQSFTQNNLNYIWKTFPIEGDDKATSTSFINVTSFIFTNDQEINPFKASSGNFNRQNSSITSVKTQNNSALFKLFYDYYAGGVPQSIEVCKSITKLPESPLMRRLTDGRLGYFTDSYVEFNNNGYETKEFIFRVRMEPRPEDMDKFLNGEMVVPAHPIVWYIDPEIPAKWRTQIKAGIEDWQSAFEETGFKNAIIARDYPTKDEDPNFDPDGVDYNCYRHVTVKRADSEGLRLVDPRSGEILSGDVMYYSNIPDLIQEFMFVQTAQINKNVRTAKVNDEMIGYALRNIATHEIGHTLGLFHNFISSSSVPVDSLRSAHFTNTSGLAPSVMDYFRYNYVAQPKDKGVALYQKHIGIYDKWMIKLGYSYFPGISSPEADKQIIDSLLYTKKGDMHYAYLHPRSPLANQNPASNREALGDDPMKAGEYGIANLKYINEHIVEWIYEPEKDAVQLSRFRQAMLKQFMNYIDQAASVIAGSYRYQRATGYDTAFETLPSATQQREALNFVVNNLLGFSNWMNRAEIIRLLGTNDQIFQMQLKQFRSLLSPAILARLQTLEITGADNYTRELYLGDIEDLLWSKDRQKDTNQLLIHEFRKLYIDFLRNQQDDAAVLAHKHKVDQLLDDMIKNGKGDKNGYAGQLKARLNN